MCAFLASSTILACAGTSRIKKGASPTFRFQSDDFRVASSRVFVTLTFLANIPASSCSSVSHCQSQRRRSAVSRCPTPLVVSIARATRAIATCRRNVPRIEGRGSRRSRTRLDSTRLDSTRRAAAKARANVQAREANLRNLVTNLVPTYKYKWKCRVRA